MTSPPATDQDPTADSREAVRREIRFAPPRTARGARGRRTGDRAVPGRAPRVPRRSTTLVQILRLAWVSDAFLAQALYRLKARLQASGRAGSAAARSRLAMAIAQVSIGDPVVVHPGVYIVHGQVVADGLVEIHSGRGDLPLGDDRPARRRRPRARPSSRASASDGRQADRGVRIGAGAGSAPTRSWSTTSPRAPRWSAPPRPAGVAPIALSPGATVPRRCGYSSGTGNGRRRGRRLRYRRRPRTTSPGPPRSSCRDRAADRGEPGEPEIARPSGACCGSVTSQAFVCSTQPGAAPSTRRPTSPAFPRRMGCPSSPVRTLTPELLRAGILRDGCLLVRGLVDREEALRFADQIDRSFAERERHGVGEPAAEGYYEEFEPDPRYGDVNVQALDQGGRRCPGGRRADADLRDDRDVPSAPGCRGWSRTISASRRCSPSRRRRCARPSRRCRAPGTRTAPSWARSARSTSGFPSLAAGTSRRASTSSRAGSTNSSERGRRRRSSTTRSRRRTRRRPPATSRSSVRSSSPGDALFFDELFLHATGSDPSMPKPRFAIENWFFGGSAFPGEYAPVAV